MVPLDVAHGIFSSSKRREKAFKVLVMLVEGKHREEEGMVLTFKVRVITA